MDINDLSEVERAVKSILNQKVRNVLSICNQHLRAYNGTCVGFRNVSLIRRLCFVRYWGKKCCLYNSMGYSYHDFVLDKSVFYLN